MCIAGLPPGGGERQFVTMVEGFLEAGCEIRIHVFISASKVFYKEIMDGTVPITFSNADRMGKIAAGITILRDLRHICSEFNPDIVFGMLFTASCMVRIARMLGLTNAAVVSTIRTDYYKLYSTKLKMIEWLLRPFAAAVVSNHYKTYRGMVDRNIRNTHYIPNGLSPDHPAVARRAENGRFNILNIGQMKFRYKNQLSLLKAVEKLRKNGTVFTCTFIGQGEDKARLEHETVELGLEQFVAVIPPVHDVWDYYSKADVVVHYSIMEGCPNVLLEAMLAGLPVICSAYLGEMDIVADGENGLVSCDNSDEGLYKKLKEFEMLDDTQRYRLGNNARRTVMAKFSKNTMIGEYLELFNKTKKRSHENG